MSKAIGLINKYYTKTLNKNTKKDITYNGLNVMIESMERETMRFTDSDVTIMVKEYQETENEIIFEALYENYYFLVKYLSKKYVHAYSGIKKKNSSVDDDLMQEYLIILKKCMKRFKKTDGGDFFKAYLVGELRNHYIMTALNKYFDVVKIPTKEYKSYRRIIASEERAGLASDLGLAKKVKNDEYLDFEDPELVMYDDLSSEESFNKLFSDEGRLINILYESLKDEDKVITFCLATGLFCDYKYSLTEIAGFLGVTVGAISKRVRKAKDKLAKHKDIKELAEEYGY